MSLWRLHVVEVRLFLLVFELRLNLAVQHQADETEKSDDEHRDEDARDLTFLSFHSRHGIIDDQLLPLLERLLIIAARLIHAVFLITVCAVDSVPIFEGQLAEVARMSHHNAAVVFAVSVTLANIVDQASSQFLEVRRHDKSILIRLAGIIFG